MSPFARLFRLIQGLVDPRSWMGLLRFVNHYNYDHVAPRRVLHRGTGVRISPTASFRAAQNVFIGDRTRIGDGTGLWAGQRSTIRIGSACSFGPGVYVTASNYELVPGQPVMDQAMADADVVIGDRCWLGAHVVVVAGVTIGDDCVVGAGAVVTKDLPPGSVAVGVPARIVRQVLPS